MTESTSVIVLTSGRSGSSMLSKMLSALGVDMGQTDAWGEDVEIQVIHKRALASVEHSWHRPPDRGTRDEMQRNSVNVIRVAVESRRNRRLWGWKDPRTPLFFQVYRDLLIGRDVRLLCLFRRPEATARNLVRSAGMSIEDALRLVHFYEALVCEAISSVSWPRFSLRYEDVLADPVGMTARLCDFVGADVALIPAVAAVVNLSKNHEHDPVVPGGFIPDVEVA